MSPRPDATWRALVVGWLGVLLLYVALPAGARPWVLVGWSAAGGGLVLHGVRRRRPRQVAFWYLLAVALAAVAAGDVAQAAAGRVTVLAQCCFLAGYLPAAVALWLLGGSDRRPRPYAWVDSAIVLVAVAVLDWQFLISPTLARDLDLSALAAAAVQPGLDLVLLALLLRLLTGRTRRGPAFWLVVAGCFATFCADLSQSVLTAAHHYRPGSWSDAFVLGLVACVTVAAHHPSMGRLGDVGPERRGSMARGLAALTPAGAVVPALMIADYVGALRLNPAAGAAASIALFGLAMARAVLVVSASERLAAVDQLTGLPNRRAFQSALQDVVGSPEAEHAAVGFFDLDEFKEVNDTHGHAIGDALIRAVAVRLRTVAGRGAVVARFGGDEFGLLLRHSGGPAQAHALVTTIAARLAEPYVVTGLRLRVGASVGLVTRLAGGDPERLMSDADVAMYTAKRRGSGEVVGYEPPMRDALLGGDQLMTDLRTALRDPDAGGLWVAYQPVVCLATGALHGTEALVRWEHPTRGPLTPDAFVPLAETHGLAAELDAFVLRTALGQLRAWTDAVPALAGTRIGVNLSVASLNRDGLDSLVLGELERAAVAPHRLALEVTEHEALASGDTVDRALARLADRGVRIALDDFGTGYSSATYFERFPVHTVKLDRSIVATVVKGRASAVVRGLGAMADALGLAVLAEGVERADQLAPLRELGFVYAQGWHFAKAGRPDEILRYAAEHGVLQPVVPAAVAPRRRLRSSAA